MKLVLPILLLFFSVVSLASAPQAGWGTTFEQNGQKVKIGGRLQGIMESRSDDESQDFYLRRTRFNISYQPWENHTLVYDIRDDNVNRGDRGEEEFKIGDAFWRIYLGHSIFKDVRFFRAKVDVSYSQTSSSKNLFNPNRAGPAEEAASFVIQNRRAANIQTNGSIGKLYFQLVLSDGVNSGDLENISGSLTVEEVKSQKLTYGGKFRYYFWGEADKNYIQDTFYGAYDAFSIGVGYFANDKIKLSLSNNEEVNLRRELLNVEFSFSLMGARFLSEHFWFDGTIFNLGDSNNRFGKSKGNYAQAEYVIGKFAPYVGYEWFDRWSDDTGYVEEATLAGINYYQNMESQRYGIAYKKSIYGSKLNKAESENIYAYIMLNF